jgi:hypothetical protein
LGPTKLRTGEQEKVGWRDEFLRELAAAAVRNGCCQRLMKKEARRLQLAEQNKINRWRRFSIGGQLANLT